MITDSELLIQSLETYLLKLTEKCFGISSLPAQTLIKYGLRNMTDKYSFILDIFTDKAGKINTDLLMNAVKSEISKRGGFKIWRFKFTEKDIDDLQDIYNELKLNS